MTRSRGQPAFSSCSARWRSTCVSIVNISACSGSKPRRRNSLSRHAETGPRISSMPSYFDPIRSTAGLEDAGRFEARVQSRQSAKSSTNVVLTFTRLRPCESFQDLFHTESVGSWSDDAVPSQARRLMPRGGGTTSYGRTTDSCRRTPCSGIHTRRTANHVHAAEAADEERRLTRRDRAGLRRPRLQEPSARRTPPIILPDPAATPVWTWPTGPSA